METHAQGWIRTGSPPFSDSDSTTTHLTLVCRPRLSFLIRPARGSLWRRLGLLVAPVGDRDAGCIGVMRGGRVHRACLGRARGWQAIARGAKGGRLTDSPAGRRFKRRAGSRDDTAAGGAAKRARRTADSSSGAAARLCWGWAGLGCEIETGSWVCGFVWSRLVDRSILGWSSLLLGSNCFWCWGWPGPHDR